MHAAITGGTGFVGTALLDLLSRRGVRVRALVRDRSRVDFGSGIELVDGDLTNLDALDELARGTDVFIHLAGVTHARDIADYHAVNVMGAVNAAKAAAETGSRFVHTSSLSARKPATSPYAQSKKDSEAAVLEASRGTAAILRLPAIYGPGDKATLPYFKMIKSGFALEPRTPSPARASLLFVEDAAAALMAAADAPDLAGVFEVGDDLPGGRAWAEIGQVLGKVMGRRPNQLRVPRPVISAYHNLLQKIEPALGRPASVRPGQVNEFFHPDWVARDNMLSDATPWKAIMPLDEGFAKTVHWYQERGYL